MLEETVAMTREAMPGIGGISSLYMYNNAWQEKTRVPPWFKLESLRVAELCAWPWQVSPRGSNGRTFDWGQGGAHLSIYPRCMRQQW